MTTFRMFEKWTREKLDEVQQQLDRKRMAIITFETSINPELDSLKGRLDAHEKANSSLKSYLLNKIRDIEANNKHLERRLMQVPDPVDLESRIANLERDGLIPRIASAEVAASAS